MSVLEHVNITVRIIYRDGHPDDMSARFLADAGHVVFSPISMTHPIAEVCELPRGVEF
jgi:hypothetical protein